MKAQIHPQYFEELKILCSCGNTIIAGSTKKTIKTEICSACHPFFTGQQKLVDTAGRVDKFMAKMKKAEAIKAKKVKKIDEEVGEMMHQQEEDEKGLSQEEQTSTQTELTLPAENMEADTEAPKETPKVTKTAKTSAKKAVKKTTAAKPAKKTAAKKK